MVTKRITVVSSELAPENLRPDAREKRSILT